ncbi:unnamed protein product [Protopolystoma xenopodis]|uniref:Secreted protein n=1 Tax=Protopolystoma xenopodis TaxID=117903 RepID=A0A448X7B2_9PLAT|nr:unnamed protein product [Protopolystoma xenopodis]
MPLLLPPGLVVSSLAYLASRLVVCESTHRTSGFGLCLALPIPSANYDNGTNSQLYDSLEQGLHQLYNIVCDHAARVLQLAWRLRISLRIASRSANRCQPPLFDQDSTFDGQARLQLTPCTQSSVKEQSCTPR